MDFRQGKRSYTNFPQDDSVFELKYIPYKDAQSYSHKISLNNYYDGDPGDIDRDINALNQCDTDARGTNDFYNGGQLENKMRNWISLATDLRDLKAKVKPGDIVRDIVKYNDNLERAKMEVIFKRLRNCAINFNNARYKDPDASYTVRRWSGYYDRYGYPTYYEYEVEIPYKIDLSDCYDATKHISKLAKRISNMESKSGMRFMDPRDWSEKLRANGRTDGSVKIL